jgi:hypothetical protein
MSDESDKPIDILDTRAQVDALTELAKRIGTNNYQLTSALYALASATMIGVEGVVAAEMRRVLPEYLNVAKMFPEDE